MIITLTLSFLVALNFILLIFSCNKTTKRVSSETTTTIKATKVVKASLSTKKMTTRTQLAPTGS
ncbi:hypothetical protein [Psychroserpens sp.]|uniref:hypothetical protein n=1 Tax=Psychroserpens sp. TaxID=2020870 RepID=UPI003859F981